MRREKRYLLKVTAETAALIRGLHPDIKSVIKSALQNIVAEPDSGKSLKDDLKGLKSYRVKRYRIIYRILSQQRQLEIIAVGPRKKIYEETFKLIREEQTRRKTKKRKS